MPSFYRRESIQEKWSLRGTIQDSILVLLSSSESTGCRLCFFHNKVRQKRVVKGTKSVRASAPPLTSCNHRQVTYLQLPYLKHEGHSITGAGFQQGLDSTTSGMSADMGPGLVWAHQMVFSLLSIIIIFPWLNLSLCFSWKHQNCTWF